MLSDDKVQVFANVRKETQQRLDALKQVDRVLYSNSRVIAECIDAHLRNVEQRVQSFKRPMHETPARHKRLTRA